MRREVVNQTKSFGISYSVTFELNSAVVRDFIAQRPVE